MTNEEYVSKGGSICPHCSSDNVSAGILSELHTDYLMIEYECFECKAMWDELYSIKLSGFENLTVDA